jgi:N-methylhydantoinase A
VQQVFADLEEQGRTVLRDEHVPEEAMYFLRSADMRYIGQEYVVNVPVGRDVAIEEIERSFHDGHQTRYGHSTPGTPVEFVNLRVAAMGVLEREVAGFEVPEAGQDPVTGTRPVIFGGRRHETTILLRKRLEPGVRVRGPLIVEEVTATTVVPPGYVARVDQIGNILISPE